MERAKGIEPSCAVWKTAVLPLNYARLRAVRFGAAGPQSHLRCLQRTKDNVHARLVNPTEDGVFRTAKNPVLSDALQVTESRRRRSVATPQSARCAGKVCRSATNSTRLADSSAKADYGSELRETRLTTLAPPSASLFGRGYRSAATLPTLPALAPSGR